MAVKIYLRSVVIDDKYHLAMFDSNRNGDIDDLTTVVEAGETIIWQLDCLSGIKGIKKIYSKEGSRRVFKKDPKRMLLSKGFKLQLTKDVAGEEEAYSIDYVLCDDTKWTTDPVIRVPPPPPPSK